MPNLFLKEENLEKSAPIVGYKILSHIHGKKLDEISIYDLADHFKKEKWFTTQTLYLGMIFLYSVNLIEFEAPYILKNVTA